MRMVHTDLPEWPCPGTLQHYIQYYTGCPRTYITCLIKRGTLFNNFLADCGKKFKRKFDLNRHRVTVHLGVRNFPCDLCGKRFADLKDMNRHKNAVHYGMKIKWNSRKYKEKAGKLKPRKQKEETLSYRKKHEPKLEETTVETWVEMEETTTGEEIITMESHEGQSVILQDENGDVSDDQCSHQIMISLFQIIQAPHFKVVEGDNGESQIFVQADNDGQVQ